MDQAQATSDFSAAAPEALIQKVAAALSANNIEAIVVDTGPEAAARVLELVPQGAEVHSGKSKTIEDIGLFAAFESGPYEWLRGRYLKMDRRTQGREIRKLIGTPDYMLGSAQAVTEEGALVFASNSASQIGPIAGGAGRVLLVVGSQKIVPNLEMAIERIKSHVFPYEDASLRKALGVRTKLSKLLVSYAEPAPGRVTVFLVREPVGV
ncbi:MAG: lactate utilization protein [Candidatus Dormibacteraeota bacterium]|nr:lactate utilization protein [Candidatus Dormibacteraeota bacterium]